MFETVGQSLRHSCGTPIKCQGISLPLDRQSYSRRLPQLKSISNTYNFLLKGTGQVSDLIHHN